MPLSEHEWESGRRWDDVEAAVAEFLIAVGPTAYSVAEVHELLVDDGVDALSVRADGDDEPAEADVPTVDVTERRVREAMTALRDADFLESKQAVTEDGLVTYYRRDDWDFDL